MYHVKKNIELLISHVNGSSRFNNCCSAFISKFFYFEIQGSDIQVYLGTVKSLEAVHLVLKKYYETMLFFIFIYIHTLKSIFKLVISAVWHGPTLYKIFVASIFQNFPTFNKNIKMSRSQNFQKENVIRKQFYFFSYIINILGTKHFKNNW